MILKLINERAFLSHEKIYMRHGHINTYRCVHVRQLLYTLNYETHSDILPLNKYVFVSPLDNVKTRKNTL